MNQPMAWKPTLWKQNPRFFLSQMQKCQPHIAYYIFIQKQTTVDNAVFHIKNEQVIGLWMRFTNTPKSN